MRVDDLSTEFVTVLNRDINLDLSCKNNVSSARLVKGGGEGEGGFSQLYHFPRQAANVCQSLHPRLLDKTALARRGDHSVVVFDRFVATHRGKISNLATGSRFPRLFVCLRIPAPGDVALQNKSFNTQ